MAGHLFAKSWSCLGTFLLTLGVLSSASRAGEPWTDEEIVDLLAKSATVDTVGYYYNDLTAASATAMLAPLKASSAFTPELAEALVDRTGELERTEAFLQELQLREMILTLDLSPQGAPLLRVVFRTDADPGQVAEALSEGLLTPRVENGLVILDNEVGEFRRGAADPGAREAIRAAFAAVADYPVVVAYVPSAKARERVADYVPPFGGETRQRLVDAAEKNVQWLAAAYAPADKGKFVLRGQSSDANGAAAFRSGWKATLAELAAAGAASGFFEQFGIDARIAPQALALAQVGGQGTALELTIDGKEAATAKVIDQAIAAWGRTVVGDPATRTQNALKQIVLAFHNFHDTFRHLPHSGAQKLPESWTGGNGVSWRVMILPFIEEGALYDQFRLEEPWDSEHNKKLIDRMPKIFRSTDPNVPANHTTYQLPLLPGAATKLARAPSFRAYEDGLANTILVVESAPDQAVIWTKPDDLEIDLRKFAALLGAAAATEFQAGMADGRIFAFPKSLKADELRRLIECADGEAVDPDAIAK